MINTNEPRRLTHIVTDQQSGKTVFVILRYGMGLSGTVLRRIKWLEDGILLDGQRVHTDVRPRAGQILSVRLSDPTSETDIPPISLPLTIVWEDRDITVVNKAPGMPSHPGPGHWGDSLGNALVYHWQKTDPFAVFHPVHRLDKGTSGLLVAAKHPFAQEKLKNQLHTPDFRRVYLAVCDGIPVPAAGTIDAPIRRADSSVLRRECAPEGMRAVTHYRTLRALGDRALVELTLETGRTHQIRVHMAHIGCPLTGDFLYGTEQPDLIARPAEPAPPGHRGVAGLFRAPPGGYGCTGGIMPSFAPVWGLFFAKSQIYATDRGNGSTAGKIGTRPHFPVDIAPARVYYIAEHMNNYSYISAYDSPLAHAGGEGIFWGERVLL